MRRTNGRVLAITRFSFGSTRRAHRVAREPRAPVQPVQRPMRERPFARLGEHTFATEADLERKIRQQADNSRRK